MVVCFLSNCLLIVPRTNCLQRKLRINIVRIYLPFQILTLGLTLIFYFLIKSHSQTVLEQPEIANSIRARTKALFLSPYEVWTKYYSNMGYKVATGSEENSAEDTEQADQALLPIQLTSLPLWLQQYALTMTLLVMHLLYSHIVLFFQVYMNNWSGLRKEHTVPPRIIAQRLANVIDNSMLFRNHHVDQQAQLQRAE